MTQNEQIPTVFFNASVILAGLKSPKGGSGLLLKWCQQNKVKGVVSEIVIDEVKRHLSKISLASTDLAYIVRKYSFKVTPAPEKSPLKKYLPVVVDPGDAHVLAACNQAKTKFLVTLDKRHLLVLRDEINEFKILSPGQFIAKIRLELRPS